MLILACFIQTTGVQFCDILVLLNHSNNVTRNEHVLVDCFEISVSVTKHVQHSYWNYQGFLPVSWNLLRFLSGGGRRVQKKLLSCGLLGGISTHADTMNIFPANHNPLDTGCGLNLNKTFKRRPECLLNVLCTFRFTSCAQRETAYSNPKYSFHWGKYLPK